MVAEHGCPRDRGVWPPQEQILEKICEQIADVHVPQVVEQIIEVHEMAEQILDVLVLEMVEQLVEVSKTVSRDGVQQRTVEQIPDAPVPQAVEELADISKVSFQDGIQQRIVEQTIPAILLAEKIVELSVIQTGERTQQGVNTHAQHIVNTVEVERSEIIKQTGQKPIIQEKINLVTKHVEMPVTQCTDNVVDIPVVACELHWCRSMAETAEIPQLQITDQVVDVPAVFVEQVPHVHVEMKTTEIPQFQVTDKVVDVPVESVVQGLLVNVVAKTVQTPQLLFREKNRRDPENPDDPGPSDL